MHQYNKEGTIISPRDYGKTEDSSLLKNIPNRDGESKSAGNLLSIYLHRLHV